MDEHAYMASCVDFNKSTIVTGSSGDGTGGDRVG
jgi:hypothetical protein